MANNKNEIIHIFYTVFSKRKKNIIDEQSTCALKQYKISSNQIKYYRCIPKNKKKSKLSFHGYSFVS